MVWTPEGYYDCSPGAEDLIGWQIHHGPDREPGFYSARQFRTVYYRPDLIGKVLKTRDVTTALREADRERGVPETDPARINEVLARLSPPTVVLGSGGVSGMLTVPANATKVHVSYRLEQGGEEPPTGVTARFNGRLLDFAPPMPKASETVEAEIPIPAKEPGDLALFASHRLAVSEAAILRIERNSIVDAPRHPNLYVLAVGVSRQRINAPGSDFQPPKGG